MPRYYRESTYHRQVRFIRRLRHFFMFILVLVTIAAGIIIYDIWRTSKKSDQPGPTTTPVTSTFASSLEVYRTQFFQFQADKDWKLIANESKDAKFVYRRFNEKLIEAQLDIYVNEAADKNINANRVLPVTYGENSDKLNALFVSERCGGNTKNAGYKAMIIQGVNFRCNTDTTDYSVLVGKEGGATLLEMMRPDGTKISYVIHFRDLRAIAVPQDIQAIVDSFQTR